MTQTPKHISVSPGEKVQINCKSSSDVTDSAGDSLIYWFQKKADQPPKRLIYWATNRHSGVPDRFSGSRSGSPYRDFTLTINGALAEDEAEYFCMQTKSFPLTQ
ncbi:unnamed protein product [Staurois parvus]|uniref:Ig-like domain-containing protein n=1 Tax=Staurois parvus TaxID=386267 RepID=A0ABN9B7D1_9NEOB|nr:unnamed protein product [Staurois parvus]